jgi:DNA-binding transcriptional regulator LsrR (DeoR family)
MPKVDDLRLMTKVSRLYHEHGMRQMEIVERLGLSQSTVSRLLKRARDERIVRVSVVVPSGVHTELEERLQSLYSLRDAVVVDVDEAESQGQRLLKDIGAAAAHYVEAILQRGEVVGVSSWSRALLAMMDIMPRMPHPTGAKVVQMLGGIGDPTKDAHASALTKQFANLVRGEPHYLPAPGVVRSAESRRYFLEDRFVRETMDLFPQITLALVGIGAVAEDYRTSSSAVVFSSPELTKTLQRGAVGDLCLRFYNAAGTPVQTPLDDSVVGISLEQLRRVRRCIAVAGGREKLAAIRGALLGGWINGLITDRLTAEALAEAPGLELRSAS